MPPGVAATARSRVSILSAVGLHAEPVITTLLKHSTTIVTGPGITVPVRSIPAGLRIR
jgi:hypothetical protein